MEKKNVHWGSLRRHEKDIKNDVGLSLQIEKILYYLISSFTLTFKKNYEFKGVQFNSNLRVQTSILQNLRMQTSIITQENDAKWKIHILNSYLRKFLIFSNSSPRIIDNFFFMCIPRCFILTKYYGIFARHYSLLRLDFSECCLLIYSFSWKNFWLMWQ